jgi:uncharacterized protein YndB with AHSA1/START domain
MRVHEATTVIDADPARVWAVLADGAGWSSWDSGVEAVEGRIAVGEKVRIRTTAAPGRAFPVTVSAVEPPRRLVFTGGMPLGLFRGVRSYTLTAGEQGGTTFVLREQFSGPLLGLIGRSIPDLQPSFTQFAEGLKKRVETGG